MKKEQLQLVVDTLDQEFELDDLFERLALIQGVEPAQKSLDAGEGIPHEELVVQMEEYMKRRDERNNMVS